MSRILKVLIVLLTIAAMVTPVMAEDRLSLSGQMRVRGFFQNIDDSVDEQSSAWNDQRLRIQAAIAVAEGVSVVTRFDIGEAKINDAYGYDGQTWGEDNTAGTTGQNAVRFSNMHFDKAYLQLVKGGYTLMAGQQYFKQGLTGVLGDHVGTGFTIKRGPVALFHTKLEDTDITGTDGDLTGAQFSFGADAFSGKVFGAYSQGTASDDTLMALGFSAAAKLEAVNIKGEVAYFNGEDAAGTDEKGLQLYVDVSAGLSDTVTLGGILLYGQAQDGGDIQASNVIGQFGEFRPLTYGYLNTQLPTVEENAFEYATNAGINALVIYSAVKVSDDLGLKFAAAYAQTDDDDVVDKNGFTLNGSFNYAVMANTAFTTQVVYKDVETSGVDKKDLVVGSGLAVKF